MCFLRLQLSKCILRIFIIQSTIIVSLCSSYQLQGLENELESATLSNDGWLSVCNVQNIPTIIKVDPNVVVSYLYYIYTRKIHKLFCIAQANAHSSTPIFNRLYVQIWHMMDDTWFKRVLGSWTQGALCSLPFSSSCEFCIDACKSLVIV